MLTDLRYACRVLLKNPSTTLGATLALALGIGATTTIFGLLNAVLLRPLPYPDGERLVELWGTVERAQVERRGTSFPDYYDWKARARSFDAVSMWMGQSPILYGAAEAVQLSGEIVDGPYFEMLGIAPVTGRLFNAADFAPNAPAVAIIGEGLWDERFGRARDVLGQSLQLGNRTYTVIGVAPAVFRGRSDTASVWTTVASTLPPAALTQRGNRSFAPLARLARGVAVQTAQAEMTTICAQLEQEYPQSNERRSAQVSPLSVELFQYVRPAVVLTFVVAAMVLLIACVNVSSLMLARGQARRPEIALRRALGADERSIARLLLSESAVLVLMGGVLGWATSYWTGAALLTLSPVQLPTFARIEADGRTLLFLAFVGVSITAAVALAPFRSLRTAQATVIRDAAADQRGGSRLTMLRILVVAQVSVAVALMVVAGLLGRSLRALTTFDPGFDPRGVLSMRVQLPPRPPAPAGSPATPDPAGVLTLIESLRGLPGVAQAALSSLVPLGGGGGAIFYSAEGASGFDATNQPRAYVHRVTPGYFAAIGLPMVEGRDFGVDDFDPNRNVVIVSENVARRFWPGQTVIGRRIKQGGVSASSPWLTIVGVVREANLRALPRNPTADPDLFFPFVPGSRAFAVVLRTSNDPGSLAGPARQAIQSQESAAAIYNVQSLEYLVSAQLAQPRFLGWLTGGFALLALTLTIVGIYGMLAYWVRRRRTEIGIRLALGAPRGSLLSLVVGQALTMAAIGIAVGAGFAALIARWMQGQLYGVGTMDWVSFSGTAVLMLVAAAAASLVPAARVLREDPVAALRSQAT
jgi:putative ABC transport system permease protein